MNKLSLYLSISPQVELIKTVFKDQQNNLSIISIRGKKSVLGSSCGQFQWTSAVKAMTLLLLRHRLIHSELPTIASIEGSLGSLACSLDYALSKEPTWICDIFGWNQNGHAKARELFLRVNPERKRPGPVMIGVNKNMLPSENIDIFFK